MHPTLRSIVSLGGGLVAAFLIFLLIQGVNSVLFPPPAGTDLRDSEAMRRFAETLPTTAFLVVLLSYAVGSFAAGWIAARYAPRGAMSHALVVGAALTLVGVMNLMALPHPTWFWVVNLPEFVLFAWLGAKVATGTRPSGAVPA